MSREFKTYLREAKKFIEEVGQEETLSLLTEAIEISNYAFGISFLRRLYESKEKVKTKTE